MKIFVKIVSILAIILCMAFICIIIFQFNNQEVNETSKNSVATITPTIAPTVEPYIDSNPIKLGLYLSENNRRLLQTTYTNTWQYHHDINTFNVFYSQQEELEDSAIRICYGQCLEKYDQDIINKYKNGFHLRFTTTEGVVDKTILSPKDTEEFYDFLEIYLYDSYHRKAGEWYSHTTEEEFNENTTLTSIKLTAGKRIDEITSDIEVMAFSYDDDDFDENGNYRGISKYSITVKRK